MAKRTKCQLLPLGKQVAKGEESQPCVERDGFSTPYQGSFLSIEGHGHKKLVLCQGP